MLEEMASKVNNSGNGVIDVYRSASLAEFHRAAGLLEVLAKRTEVIKERWPEVCSWFYLMNIKLSLCSVFKAWFQQVSLSLILEAISSFRNARLNTTHMKMSVLIENVIEQCEEWEKMADRANSLQHELAPLRELLVDWKKMEVRSWGELLNRVENDGRVRAQLVAFPLFDALFKAETPDAQNGLIAMATEWVTNASLLDYAARIRSVHCLAEWAKLLGHCSVSLHLHSIAAHYEQYLSVVEASLREARDHRMPYVDGLAAERPLLVCLSGYSAFLALGDRLTTIFREPAEHALRDYVKIVKFNDLNLWNIKKSSQKAHTHLYKIVRKFRDAVGVPVSPYFDNLVEMDPPCAASPSAIPLVEGVVGHGMRARQLAETILAKGWKFPAATVCDVSAAVALAEQTKSCDEAIRVQIDYQGEDEEKEKQQGYARNSRQRAVAMVIKESQSIGLNARKAMALNQEELTRSSLTEVKRCVAKEPFVRKCAGGRNACIRKAMSPNDQLGVATRKHLLGVVGLYVEASS
ncbi:unnamed protein product [Heligmosomoides polygyrus]|uniref:Uncharacterized protein n=1 Tax=Heligmosomoides polygyrus TaxID=6339 RepID=A0A3P8D3C0_HELPZ|nr:unnamed protein product [Heligmosomoides polygyrus]